VERLGLDINYLLEVFSDPAHQFLLLLLGSSLVHMNMYNGMFTSVIERINGSIMRVKGIRQEAQTASPRFYFADWLYLVFNC
jgi:hypothetical protein